MHNSSKCIECSRPVLRTMGINEYFYNCMHSDLPAPNLASKNNFTCISGGWGLDRWSVKCLLTSIAGRRVFRVFLRHICFYLRCRHPVINRDDGSTNDSVRTRDDPVQEDPQQEGIRQMNRRQNLEPTEYEFYQLFLYVKLHPKATQATIVKWFPQQFNRVVNQSTVSRMN